MKVTLASSIRTTEEGVGVVTDIRPKEEIYYNYEVEFGNRIFWLCEEEIVREDHAC